MTKPDVNCMAIVVKICHFRRIQRLGGESAVLVQESCMRAQTLTAVSHCHSPVACGPSTPHASP